MQRHKSPTTPAVNQNLNRPKPTPLSLGKFILSKGTTPKGEEFSFSPAWIDRFLGNTSDTPENASFATEFISAPSSAKFLTEFQIPDLDLAEDNEGTCHLQSPQSSSVGESEIDSEYELPVTNGLLNIVDQDHLLANAPLLDTDMQLPNDFYLLGSDATALGYSECTKEGEEFAASYELFSSPPEHKPSLNEVDEQEPQEPEVAATLSPISYLGEASLDNNYPGEASLENDYLEEASLRNDYLKDTLTNNKDYTGEYSTPVEAADSASPVDSMMHISQPPWTQASPADLCRSEPFYSDTPRQLQSYNEFDVRPNSAPNITGLSPIIPGEDLEQLPLGSRLDLGQHQEPYAVAGDHLPMQRFYPNNMPQQWHASDMFHPSSQQTRPFTALPLPHNYRTMWNPAYLTPEPNTPPTGHILPPPPHTTHATAMEMFPQGLPHSRPPLPPCGCLSGVSPVTHTHTNMFWGPQVPYHGSDHHQHHHQQRHQQQQHAQILRPDGQGVYASPALGPEGDSQASQEPMSGQLTLLRRNKMEVGPKLVSRKSQSFLSSVIFFMNYPIVPGGVLNDSSPAEKLFLLYRNDHFKVPVGPVPSGSLVETLARKETLFRQRGKKRPSQQVKCRMLHCSYTTSQFKDLASHFDTEHLASANLRDMVYCYEPDCAYSVFGFLGLSNYKRHLRCEHGINCSETGPWLCPGCDENFYNPGQFWRHFWPCRSSKFTKSKPKAVKPAQRTSNKPPSPKTSSWPTSPKSPKTKSTKMKIIKKRAPAKRKPMSKGSAVSAKKVASVISA